MKVHEMSADTLRHLALKCADTKGIRLPKYVGPVPAASGDWLIQPARSEAVKRWWRLAKKDLADRQNGVKSATDKFHGDFGRVEIGGKMFTYYPNSDMLVRDNFAVWAEANFDRFVLPCGGPKQDAEPEERERISRVENWITLWKRIRSRLTGIKVSAMMKKGEWNSEWDMRTFMTRYAMEIAKDDAKGEYYSVSHIQADMLKGNIAYVNKDFRTAVESYLSAAAACIATARFIQIENYDEEADDDGE